MHAVRNLIMTIGMALALMTPMGAWAAGEETAATGPVIEIQTQYGLVVIETYPQDAPQTVAHITKLARDGFYNGVTFHRVVENFVVQGGDPTGTGRGGSGQTIPGEFSDRKHVEGSVAMARTDNPDSADSQFYIALGRLPHLDGKYAIFGQVTSGMDAVKQIKRGDRMIKVSVR